jgi:hypothetical protein
VLFFQLFNILVYFFNAVFELFLHFIQIFKVWRLIRSRNAVSILILGFPLQFIY